MFSEQYYDSLQKLSIAIYAPYKPYIQGYKEYEDAILENSLNNIRLVSLFFLT